MPTRPMIERVMERVEPEPNSGCWLWTGGINAYGYGQIKSLGEVEAAYPMVHRVVYEHFQGRIPDGLVTDHLCRVRICVNPAHLEPVTNQENIRRATRLLTSCKLGHPLDMVDKRGWRRCRTCHLEQSRRAWNAYGGRMAA